MRLYDNAPASYHDELASWFPEWYRHVKEMDALWNTWGILLDKLQADIRRVVDNCFLVSCDEETVTFWEDFMGIEMNIQHTLEERRRFVMTHFSGFGKCSATQIKGIIKQYTRSDAYLRFQPCDANGNHELYILMENGEAGAAYLDDLHKILEKVIPAHIPVNINVNLQEGQAAAYPMAAAVILTGELNVTAHNY